MNDVQEKNIQINKLVEEIRLKSEFQAISFEFKKKILDLRSRNDSISQTLKATDLAKLTLEKENQILSNKLAKLLTTLKNIESNEL
jgi:hypothetical protein